jgi:hypothetical protein
MRYRIASKVKDASKFEVFNNWKFANDFGLKHFKQALCDLVPGSYSTDVIQYWRALTKGHSLFHRFNEFNAAEIHEVFTILGQC